MELSLFLLACLAYVLFVVINARSIYKVSAISGLLALLVPPVLIYRRFWFRFRLPVIGQVTSLVAIIVFGLLYVRQHPFQFDGHYLSGFRNWAAPAFADKPLKVGAAKAPIGQSFHYLEFLNKNNTGITVQWGNDQQTLTSASFKNGILRLYNHPQGQNGYFEIAIDLSESVTSLTELLSVEVPGHTPVPTVSIITRNTLNARPQVTVLNHYYSLELLLEPYKEQRLKGTIRLQFPGPTRQFAAGRFRAYTKDLLWVLGQVERSYNSNDTIEYIASDYLSQQLETDLTDKISFSNTYYQTHLNPPTARTVAEIHIDENNVFRTELTLNKNKRHWVVNDIPIKAHVAAARTFSDAPPAAIPPSSSVLKKQQKIRLEDIQQWIGKPLKITMVNGFQREGLLRSVSDTQIRLVKELEEGQMEVPIKTGSIAKIEPFNPPSVL